MENPIFDYSKLKGKIIEKYGTQKEFINTIHMSEPTFINKINNGSYFKQDEIITIMSSLELSLEYVKEFFYDKVIK